MKGAVEFIKKFHGAHNGRLQGILNPAQAETCEPSLSKELPVGSPPGAEPMSW